MGLNTRDTKANDAPKNTTKKPTVKKGQTKSFQAASEPEKAPQRTLSMTIDADLHRKLKMAAVARGQTIREIVMEMIRGLDDA